MTTMKRKTQSMIMGALLIGLGVLAVGSLLWAVTAQGERSELRAEIAKHTRTVQEQRLQIEEHEAAGRTLDAVTAREARVEAKVAEVNATIDRINEEHAGLDEGAATLAKDTADLRARMTAFQERVNKDVAELTAWETALSESAQGLAKWHEELEAYGKQVAASQSARASQPIAGGNWMATALADVQAREAAQESDYQRRMLEAQEQRAIDLNYLNHQMQVLNHALME
jgi:predicted nuclease with TOPRIM domain